jgi:hypothetical protein
VKIKTVPIVGKIKSSGRRVDDDDLCPRELGPEWATWRLAGNRG